STIETKFATAAPPMFMTPASDAPGICMSPAVPVTCIAASTCIDTPVAPTGWPLDLRPPEGLIGSLPSFSVQPSRMARAPCPFGASPIASYSINSAIVKQSCVSTRSRSRGLRRGGERPLPRQLRPLESENVALGDRQKIVDLLGCAERDGLFQRERGLDIGEHDRRRAIRDQRAIGALERAG